MILMDAGNRVGVDSSQNCVDKGMHNLRVPFAETMA